MVQRLEQAVQMHCSKFQFNHFFLGIKIQSHITSIKRALKRAGYSEKTIEEIVEWYDPRRIGQQKPVRCLRVQVDYKRGPNGA